MHPDPRQTPNAPGPDASTPDQELANETYTTFAREDADVPDLQPLLDDYTDQDKLDSEQRDIEGERPPAPRPDDRS